MLILWLALLIELYLLTITLVLQFSSEAVVGGRQVLVSDVRMVIVRQVEVAWVDHDRGRPEPLSQIVSVRTIKQALWFT